MGYLDAKGRHLASSTESLLPGPSLRATQRGARAAHGGANRARVLVAGDSREHRAHLAHMLGRDGCDVVEFQEWLQLVNFLRRMPLFDRVADPADVVLLDLRMSGRPLLDRVVAVTEDRIPIVLVTAPGAGAAARANWVVLEEPFSADDLRQAVVRCALGRARGDEP